MGMFIELEKPLKVRTSNIQRCVTLMQKAGYVLDVCHQTKPDANEDVEAPTILIAIMRNGYGDVT